VTEEGGREDIKKTLSRFASEDSEGDLDRGFDAGIRSWTDISTRTLKKALINSRYLQILIVLTLVGLFLRFYHITFNSLWTDEIYTYFFSKNSFIDIWFVATTNDYNPPLFYWIEHFMLYFGNNEFILRFAPAVIGTSTIPLIYFLGKIFLDRNCGIVMAALITISPFHITYSQEARAYTMMLFFLTLALIFFFKALQTNAVRSWVLFGVFSGFAFWTHFYAIIPVISLFIVALGLNARKIWNEVRFIIPLIKGALIFFIASLPLLFVVGKTFHTVTGDAPTWGMQGRAIITHCSSIILVNARGFSGYYTIFSGYTRFVLIIYFVLFLIGIITIFMMKRKKAYLLIVMIMIPLVISWALSYRMPMDPRYLIYLILFYFMGIAAAYIPLFNLGKSKRVIYLFLLFLIVINIPLLVSYYQAPIKYDYRGLSGMIQEVARPGDIIVLIPGSFNQMPFNYYYLNQSIGIEEYGIEDSIPQLEAIFQQKGEGRIFYVLTYFRSREPILEWLENHAIKVDKNLNPSTESAYKDIDLYIST